MEVFVIILVVATAHWVYIQVQYALLKDKYAQLSNSNKTITAISVTTKAWGIEVIVHGEGHKRIGGNTWTFTEIQLYPPNHPVLKGAKALSEAAATKKEGVSCWFILGMLPTTDASKVEQAYRKMAMVYHPDQGGNAGAFLSLQRAKEAALRQCV